MKFSKTLLSATLVSMFAATAYAQTEQAVEGVNNPNRSSVADTKERFGQYDANKDGMMDENEFNEYQASYGTEQAVDGVNNPNRSSVANTKPRFFADYDKNQDGMMDEMEFGDYELSLNTEQAVDGVNNPNRSSVANTKPRFFADYDTNRDGNISREEGVDLSDRWDEFDANVDGMMDEDEFSLFEQAWQKEQGVGTNQ